MSFALRARCGAALEQRDAQALRRNLQVSEPSTAGRVLRAGKSLINFASNDYLGLREDAQLRAAFAESAARYGLGAGASHLLGGHSYEHAALEAELADWLGRERVLLFSSGYQAALGALSAVLRPGDLCVADKLSHASLIDGVRVSGASLRRFAHQQLAHADELLGAPCAGLKMLVSEAIFSMDGDQAPVCELAVLANQHGAALMLDEAHSLGVLGSDGCGLARGNGLTDLEIAVTLVTFGKALGGFGAAIAGSAQLVDTLINFSRPYVYTTALPPALAAGLRVSVQMARTQNWRRAHLLGLIARFRERAAQLGLALGQSASAIQPIFIGGPARALQVSAQLAAAGFYVPAIRPPTVPPGSARLRVSLSAVHSEQHVDALLEALPRALAASA